METPQIGTVVEADRGLYRHRGLFYGWRGGTTLVLANLPGGTRIQTWKEFSGGRHVNGLGYPSKMMYWQVLARAESVMNRPYSWLTWNCEHFVAYAHGRKVESPQVLGWAMAAGVLGIALMTTRG
jgi:hypothetical protein